MPAGLGAPGLRGGQRAVEIVAGEPDLDASPPKVRVLAIFCCGVVTGMKITPCTPKWRQAKATPWAWLPALAQTKMRWSGRRHHLAHRVEGAAQLVGAHRRQVLALEPDVGPKRWLRWSLRCSGVGSKSALRIHGASAAALGAAEGVATLRLNRANPTVSTLSEAFIAATRGAEGWQGQAWDDSVEVPVMTLDALIGAHGCPDFLKIDVEGLEDEVLAGLGRAVPALSFEMTTIRRGVARRALERIASLGPYRFALSLGEGFRLDTPWLDMGRMADRIDALPQAANSGDVYARLGPD
jgi:FkbM family methyltransferase